MKALLAATFAVAALLVIGGGAGAVSGSPIDQWWLQGAIQGDRFEVAGGVYAEKNAQTPEARALAAQLVGDHRHSLGNAIGLARHLGIAVPKAPSPVQQWLIVTLKGMKSGSAYDQAYTSLAVKDHMQDIADTQLEIKSGRIPAVVTMAKHELKTLKVHLILAQKAMHAST